MASSDGSAAPETIAQAIPRMRRAFEAAGIEHAAGDTRRLIAAALDVNAVTLISDPARRIDPVQAVRLASFVARRVSREPVSRILGIREFYGRPFAITPAVLDPRADTETLIETALKIATREGWLDRSVTILDIGTGSGAILLTLLAALPHATGVGLDVSETALDVAKRNAASLNLVSRATFQQADIRHGMPKGFDLVVSNPPYISAADVPTLEPEVRNFDPHLALDGGEDGLNYYRSIIAGWVQAATNASKSCWLVLEAGVGQSEQVLDIARGHGLVMKSDNHEVVKDLEGHPRCVTIKRN